MAKNYLVKNTGVSVVSGKISKIADDKKSAVITVSVYNRDTKQNVSEEVAITSNEEIEVNNGQYVTAMGFKRGQNIAVERLAADNACLTLEGTTVVTGLVLFANKNLEKDKDGNPRKTSAGTDRKPHYDITVAVGQGADRETHVIKFYDFTTKEGRAVENIARYEKLFSNFDRNENPVFVSIVTDEGQAWVRKNTDANGKEWQNNMVSHMGANSVDVNFVNAKERTNENQQSQQQAQAPAQTQTQAAPTQAAPVASAPQQEAPAVTNDGFEMDGLDLSGLDDLENLGI